VSADRPPKTWEPVASSDYPVIPNDPSSRRPCHPERKRGTCFCESRAFQIVGNAWMSISFPPSEHEGKGLLFLVSILTSRGFVLLKY
jgi:hypothetical protein